MKKFQNITKKQVEQYGVQALSDRPNSAGTYGGGGLSPLELKLWFDQLATFEANKINEIHDILASDEAAEYIAIALHDNGIHDLSQLVAAIKSGALANILELYPTAGSDKRVNLQNAIYSMAKTLSDHDHEIKEVLKKPPYTESDPSVPDWAKQPAKPTYTPAEIGAAPDGFGLGKRYGKYVSDANTALENGWFYGNSNTINTVISGATFITSKARDNDTTFQRIETVGSGTEISRRTNDGGVTWIEEYVNPPLAQGVEYRTTERMGGKPVYKKNDNGVTKYRLDGETGWKDYAPVYGAAPAGYGRGNLIKAYCLSESDVWIDKINSILKNLPYGLTYRISFQDYWTVPTQICNGILWKSGESDALVRGTAYNGITIQRSMKNGVWQPWEYENPPMALGVEYRTTERYKGKPLYVKAMDCGELPIGTAKFIEYGDSVCRALFCYGECGGLTIPSMNFGGSLESTYPSKAIISLWCNKNTLCIACGGDRSGVSTTVIVKYWKTTD